MIPEIKCRISYIKSITSDPENTLSFLGVPGMAAKDRQSQKFRYEKAERLFHEQPLRLYYAEKELFLSLCLTPIRFFFSACASDVKGISCMPYAALKTFL